MKEVLDGRKKTVTRLKAKKDRATSRQADDYRKTVIAQVTTEKTHAYGRTTVAQNARSLNSPGGRIFGHRGAILQALRHWFTASLVCVGF